MLFMLKNSLVLVRSNLNENTMCYFHEKKGIKRRKKTKERKERELKRPKSKQGERIKLDRYINTRVLISRENTQQSVTKETS